MCPKCKEGVLRKIDEYRQEYPDDNILVQIYVCDKCRYVDYEYYDLKSED